MTTYIRCTVDSVEDDQEGYIRISVIYKDDSDNFIRTDKIRIPSDSTPEMIAALWGDLKSNCKRILMGTLIRSTINVGDQVDSQ